MTEALPALEKDRAQVLRQIADLGDLRPGSIVEVMLLHRPISCRYRTGHRKYRILSERAAHTGPGGPGGSLRSRREQMQVLAGLEVTAKSMERTADAARYQIK
jgi:hypothetical protein